MNRLCSRFAALSLRSRLHQPSVLKLGSFRGYGLATNVAVFNERPRVVINYEEKSTSDISLLFEGRYLLVMMKN